MFFKEENMKKWLNILKCSQELNIFVDEIVAQVPGKEKVLREIVSEGEKRLISTIEDKIMEIPENIQKVLEEFRKFK